MKTGELKTAWMGTEKLEPLNIKDICTSCQQEIYFIAIADRAVKGTLGILNHYSLELWSSSSPAQINTETSVDSIRRQGSQRLKGVELLREGGWIAYHYNYSLLDLGHTWSETDVAVSVIHQTSSADQAMPIHQGTQQAVFQIWNTALSTAGSYPYAEQQGFQSFQHWPDSIYEIGDDVNNSNTFVRFLVRSIGLTMLEMNGLHPGRDMPIPIAEPRRYSTPWREGTQAPPPPLP